MGGNQKSGEGAGVGAFGAALRLHRQRRALSQEDLADATRGGVATRTISDLERGVARRPRAETVRLLAAALGLSGPELAAFRAAARAGRDGPDPGRRAATGPLIIVADAARLAEVESLLSATPDCLVLVTSGQLLSASAERLGAGPSASRP